MDPASGIPYCPIPTETVSDVIPLLIVLGLFLMAGWWFRRRKKGRGRSK